MKEIKVNMTNDFIELASKPIRTKNHVIQVLLEAISILSYGKVVERPTQNYILLRIDKMKRLFFIIDKKFFSFYFPFMLELRKDKANPIIYDRITGLEMNAKNVSVIKSLFMESFFEENQNLLELESELFTILESLEMIPNKDEMWQVLKDLLIFESGYLRFDYDEENQNGKLHPLNHFDINYSSQSTFKIGIHKTIGCTDFIDIVDLNTNSYFLTDV